MPNNVTGITDGNGHGAAYKDSNGNFATHQLDASGYLQVNVAAGGASGTQYAEGTTQATATGTAMLWKDGSNVERQVSAGNPMPVQPYMAGSAVSSSNALPMYDSYSAPTSSNWNTSAVAGASGIGTTLAVTTSGMDCVVVTAVNTAGTFTGGHITFEVYDGAAWLPIKGFRPSSYNGESGYALSGLSNQAWQFSIAGFPQFRVRLDTAITGTSAPTMAITAIVSSAPDVSGVTVGLDPSQPLPAGTNTLGGVNIAQGLADGTATGSVSATGVLATLALAGYKGCACSVTSFGSGTVVAQVSADGGTTWTTVNVVNVSNGSIQSSIAGTGQFYIPAQGGAYGVRLNCTSYTSGTMTAALRGTVLPNQAASNVMAVSNTGLLSITTQGKASAGSQANAWNAASVGVSGNSNSVDTQIAGPSISVFGNTSTSTNITIYVSQDSANFYNSGTTLSAVNGDFHSSFTTGARYIRLQSSAAATITATIAGHA